MLKTLSRTPPLVVMMHVFPCYWVLFCPVSRALIIKKTKTVLEKRERGVEALEHAKFLVTLS